VPSGTIPHLRELASKFSKSQTITQDDGSLLIRGVPMLASGIWTDSAVGTPLFYPEKTLSEYATNWSDRTGWSRHMGGVPRDITDKVAEATNLRYENSAVTADIVVHGATQKSRDTIELVKRKLISFVSVEHGGSEVFNKETRQMEASTLTFSGFSFVNRGACTKCRINEAQTDTPAAPVEQETMADNKELEAAITAAVTAATAPIMKELEAVRESQKKPTDVKIEIPKELAALPGAMKELSDKFEARIKALETEGTPKTGTGQTKELESMPEFSVHVDRKHGIVGA